MTAPQWYLSKMMELLVHRYNVDNAISAELRARADGLPHPERFGALYPASHVTTMIFGNGLPDAGQAGAGPGRRRVVKAVLWACAAGLLMALLAVVGTMAVDYLSARRIEVEYEVWESTDGGKTWKRSERSADEFLPRR